MNEINLADGSSLVVDSSNVVTDPGVYSRVSDEFDWIKEQVCAMSPEGAPTYYFGCEPVGPLVGGSCANY
jgi:hypothetical protein